MSEVRRGASARWVRWTATVSALWLGSACAGRDDAAPSSDAAPAEDVGASPGTEVGATDAGDAIATDGAGDAIATDGAGDAIATDGATLLPEELLVDQEIVASGITRRYTIFVPPRAASDVGTLRYVILFHGNAGSAEQLLGLDGKKAPWKLFLEIARRDKVVVVVPDGAIGTGDDQGWNDCRGDATSLPKTDDVAFVDALRDVAKARGADPGKGFAAGMSNGGNFVMRLMAERPKSFVAYAAVAAALPAVSKCPALKEPASLLLVNGTADKIRPDAGGKMAGLGRGTVLGSQATVDTIAAAYGLAAKGAPEPLADLSTDDDSTVKLVRYEGPAAVLRHYVVEGGGHTEPSRVQRYAPIFLSLVGPQNGDVETAEVVWSFFLERSK